MSAEDKYLEQAFSETDDGWNWPWILFAGHKFLGWSEEKTWDSTPKKFYSLMEVYYEYKAMLFGSITGKNKTKQNEAVGYIDQIPGW